MLIVLIFVIHIVTNVDIFLDIGLLAVCMLTVIWLFFMFLNPDISQKITKTLRKKSYERSLITGLNTEVLKLRLRDLMEDEKLFCDEDLTLRKLAMLLNISSHQLSELLNNVMNTNFRAYLNNYRIIEAKFLLQNEPNRSITSIAYSSGFNSLSVFYNVFSKETGTTPKAYRLNVLTK